MFVCQVCGRVVPPRTPAARVVAHTRPKQYPYRVKANHFYRPGTDGKRRERWIDDPGGVGWEIGREVLACPDCAPARSLPQRE
jgi:hypothetical protein